MLSAVIATRHSYPAVPLAGQLVDQRSVHPGPLVAKLTPRVNFIPCFQERRLYLHPSPPVRNEDGGILPTGAVILDGMIPLPVSPRIFQRKSLRGQTKHCTQFFFCLSFLTHVVFVLNEHELSDNRSYILRLHGTERLPFKHYARLNEQFRLFLFETKIRFERLQRLSHLREPVDTQLCHSIVSSRNISAPNPISNP